MANGALYQRGELGDRQVFAAANVDEIAWNRPGVNITQNKEASIGKIIYVQKFALRCAAAPHGDGGISRQLGFMEFAHHGRQNVRRRQIKIIARAI